MNIEKKYRKLDDKTHILLRPGMYLGSIKSHDGEKFLINDNKIELKNVKYIPGFLKIFDEILSNSVDESRRENSKVTTIKINIEIETGKITIWDNGGIPVVKHPEYNEWIPEMIFSNMKSGSNFNDDEQRTVAGTNGVGSTITNVFSKEFNIVTCDGENIFRQTYSNNMNEKTKPSIRKSTKNHTEISYIPDYERFGMEKLDDDHLSLIEKRVYDVAGTNANLKIYFNDKLINFKSFKDYIQLYTDDFIFETDKKWSLGIAKSNDGSFNQVSFVNTTETYDGGTHIDNISNQIITKLREFFKKKHKVDIKPAEIKNHLFIFLDSTVINPHFSSQTKEKLITEVKDFGHTYQVSDKTINAILKSEIVESILDWIDRKKLAEDNKLARDLNKNLSKLKVDKLIDAKGKDRWKCSLCIFEGDSAANATRNFRDPDLIGSFALRGKFINVSEVPTSTLIANREAINLMAAIGLQLGEKADRLKLRYGKIIIYTDQDYDGYSISALLLNFFNKYWPELFEYGMVYKAETPIVIVTELKTKKVIKFYTFEDYDEWISTIKDLNKWDISYKKGLSALSPDEYKDIVNEPMLTKIIKDGDRCDEKLNIWFGKNSELRKNELI